MGNGFLKKNHTNPRSRGVRAFSLIELVVIILAIALIAGLLLPYLTKARAIGLRLSCVSNLGQVGLSFRSFAHDNQGKLPWEIPITNGGAMELASVGGVLAQFRAASNELVSPRALTCPADTRSQVTHWTNLTETNISYFIGLEARADNSQSLLSGDRNLETNGVAVGPGLLIASTNVPVGWTEAIHKNPKNSGNICLGDGYVHKVGNSWLKNQVQAQGIPTNRLLIP